MAEPKIVYYPNGNKKEECYWDLNELHREDGPAVMLWYDDGKIQSIQYLQNDMWHRTDGPANICFEENGNIYREGYYLNGEEYSDLASPLIRNLGLGNPMEWTDGEKDMFALHLVARIK